jgi:tRNA threonylcarbamoyladenosine biosynthesis protein TsaB
MAVALVNAAAMPLHVLAHHEAGGALASARLMGVIDTLLAQASVPLSAVKAVAWARGPGAFTGVRTAASVAQGLALGLGVPVIGLDGLMIVADAAYHQKRADKAATVWQVAMDARMGQLYVGSYERHAGGGWQTIHPPSLVDAVDYSQAIQGATRDRAQAWAGSAGAAHPALQELASMVDIDGAARSQALARLAAWQWMQGAAQDAALVEPWYVRNTVAQTQAERDAAAAAKNVALKDAAP